MQFQSPSGLSLCIQWTQGVGAQFMIFHNAISFAATSIFPHRLVYHKGLPWFVALTIHGPVFVQNNFILANHHLDHELHLPGFFPFFLVIQFACTIT